MAKRETEELRIAKAEIKSAVFPWEEGIIEKIFWNPRKGGITSY